MKEIRSKGPRDESVRLGWDPGTMQVDFGQADFDYAFGGGRARMHYLPMSFPYSNHEVCEVFADEKDVCVCQGLKDCFEHIGGVPPVIVLDNATEAGRMAFGKVTESRLFSQFRARYRCESRYCNPYSGNEKGSVENKVGAMRRSLFVPVPQFDNVRRYNERLLDMSIGHSDKVHYRKGESQLALFEEDCFALSPLPDSRFSAVSYTEHKADIIKTDSEFFTQR